MIKEFRCKTSPIWNTKGFSIDSRLAANLETSSDAWRRISCRLWTMPACGFSSYQLLGCTFDQAPAD